MLTREGSSLNTLFSTRIRAGRRTHIGIRTRFEESDLRRTRIRIAYTHVCVMANKKRQKIRDAPPKTSPPLQKNFGFPAAATVRVAIYNPNGKGI